MISITQVKIFQNEDPSLVNQCCNEWLFNNKNKLGPAKIDFKYSGEFHTTAGYPCSLMLIITNLNPANKNWDWSASSGDFILDACTC